jgi:glycosyltransferase involved in cell wall biosynthesis
VPTRQLIRVAHCLEQVRSGGVERRRLSLARKLDPERFEQMLICTEVDPELRSQFEAAGCKVAEIGAMRRGIDWRRIRVAASLLRNFRPHIVHGAVFEGVIIATLAGKLARVPAIIAEETITPVGRRWTGHLYYRLLTALADRVVAISGAVSDYLTKSIRLPPSKVRLIVNGVAEPDAPSPAEVDSVRTSLGLTDGALVIGTAGRLASPRRHSPDAHKRIADAIFAMRQVLEQFPSARLLIVGDGPDRRFLEQFAAREGLTDSVIFAGFQPRVRPYLECMDVLVHPSQTEGLPLLPVEAMFASKPIVASDVAGSNEVVVDGETGFLVPVRNPDALAQRLIELLASPELRTKMGAAGLRRARRYFSEERYVREVGEMYQELVAQHGRGGK